MRILAPLAALLPVGLLGLLPACEDHRLVDLTRDPHSVRIVVNPLRASYRVDEVVGLDYVVLDEAGVILPDVPATWETPPFDDVIQRLDGRWQFSQPGAFTWRVTLAPPHQALQDQVTLAVPVEPASLEITVSPEAPVYRVGDEVSVGYVVRDAQGRELTGLPVGWQEPDPAAAEPLGGPLYALRREGVHTWVASLPAPWHLRAERSLAVDGEGPVLVVERPERGDTLRKDTPQAEVSVQGAVTDDGAGVLSVRVRARDGVERQAQLSPHGSFSLLMPAQPGLNTLEVVAEDAVGQTTRVTRAFYYAPDFLDPEAEPERLLPEAWDAALLDRGLDRGRPLDAPPYDPCGFDAVDAYTCQPLGDIASLLEIGLNGVAFEELPSPLAFTFPIVDRTWGLATIDTLEVSIQLQGRFDLSLGFRELRAGEAKVFELASRQDGLRADLRYRTYLDAQGVSHPGLRADLGLLGVLTFELSLRLTGGSDPALACLLAALICNQGVCLHEYLEVCTAPWPPRPLASIVSTIDSPMLVGLSASGMRVEAELLAFLAAGLPEVLLDQLGLQVEPGGLDLSALASLDIDLGQVDVVGYQFDLGHYQLDTQFIADLADALVDPILDALQPVLELVLGQLLTCQDAVDPVCFFVPFLRDVLRAFRPPEALAVEHPFLGQAPLVEATLASRATGLDFRAGFGGRFQVAARAAAARNPIVTGHADDDHLGLPLLGGCLGPDPGFGGRPAQGRGVQLAPSLDLVNSLLFAAWNAAGLDLELDEAALGLGSEWGVSALALELRPTLAPLLNACAGAGADFELQLGDLGFSLSLRRGGLTYSAAGFLSLARAAELEVRAGRLGLAPGPTRHTLVEFTGLSVAGRAATVEEQAWLEELLVDGIAPALLDGLGEAVVQSLSALEPVIDISRFPGLGQAGASLRLDDRWAETSQGRIVVNADLLGP
jgi:hypothetical protein